MANISTANDEFILLRFITSPKYKKFIKKNFSKYVNPDIFINSHIKKAIQRVHYLYIERDILLSFKELIRDTSLPEETKQFLRKKERIRKQSKDETLELPSNRKELDALFNQLQLVSTYKRLVDLNNSISDKLRGIDSSTLDNETIKELQLELFEKVNSIPLLANDGKLFTLTKSSTKKEIISFKEKLNNRFFIPTGFRGFDKVNIGIPKDSLFLIGAKTGCGKSAMVIQLAMNMKLNGASVCIVPLEMTVDQILMRMASNRLGVTINEIIANYDYYEPKIVKALSPFIFNDDSPSRFDIYTPEPDETIIDILDFLKPNNYDIIFIDLINLVAPLKSENEQQSLNKAGRFAKVFATSNETIICLVAQLDEDKNRVRYARALLEHASNSWFWYENIDDIVNRNGEIKIIQKKARNQVPTPFFLKTELKYYRFRDADLSHEDLPTNNNKKKRRKYKEFDRNKFDSISELEEIPTEDEE